MGTGSPFLMLNAIFGHFMWLQHFEATTLPLLLLMEDNLQRPPAINFSLSAPGRPLSHQEVESMSISPSHLGWPCDLPWSTEWDRSNIVPIRGQPFKRTSNFYFHVGQPAAGYHYQVIRYLVEKGQEDKHQEAKHVRVASWTFSPSLVNDPKWYQVNRTNHLAEP